MIIVIDYGMGNLSSVTNAIKLYTEDVKISSEPKDIKNAAKIVLPGVGAFKDAYAELKKRGLIKPIKDFIDSGKPFLGICLGLQLLFTKSYEDGMHSGLGIIKGKVVPFAKGKGLKIPHMGWNSIDSSQKSKKMPKLKMCPLLKGVKDGSYMYFVHSYYAVPADDSVVAATTDYGNKFCSFLWKDNIYAMQFHPEKSQDAGLNIIKNFVRLKR
ncbi:MAG: imidazole glycerol phosphate synthase subunit HisH [Candidatus Omnitrophota bacterium]